MLATNMRTQTNMRTCGSVAIFVDLLRIYGYFCGSFQNLFFYLLVWKESARVASAHIGPSKIRALSARVASAHIALSPIRSLSARVASAHIGPGVRILVQAQYAH